MLTKFNVIFRNIAFVLVKWLGFLIYKLQEKACLGSAAADTEKSKTSKHPRHGYHLVKGKSRHDMEDYVFAQFKQVENNELGLFAIFDGHVSREIADYLQSHLFENILNEVRHVCTGTLVLWFLFWYKALND